MGEVGQWMVAAEIGDVSRGQVLMGSRSQTLDSSVKFPRSSFLLCHLLVV